MTTIGDILDEFFSPLSTPTLWVMPEGDNYTKIVRSWQPVINAVANAKADIAADCATWASTRGPTPGWKATPTKPGQVDPNAYPEWVNSPPGTDPETCKKAFIIYVTSKAAKLPIFGKPVPIPEIQTKNLYTCSIGSFDLYTTATAVDCAGQTAIMDFWMYNTMDQSSFGRFATHPAFKLSRMQPQYMWWNWTEGYSWGAAPAPTVPSKGGTSKW